MNFFFIDYDSDSDSDSDQNIFDKIDKTTNMNTNANKKTIKTCLICWEEPTKKNAIKKMKSIVPSHRACQCNGNYHVSCFDTWYELHKSCPICRTQITNEPNISYVLMIDYRPYFLHQATFYIQIVHYILKIIHCICIIMFFYYVLQPIKH